MLSAAKVKLHGMQDDRWVIKDKIAQYRGINALYERDRELFNCDLVQSKKQFTRDIRRLRTDIAVKRDELGVAVFGDKQFIRNVLQDHRRLQLAYMNSQADKVLECIHQSNFNKKKLLDKIQYEKKKKFERFRQLQLESAEVQDRILYEKGRHPVELQEQAVSNYVQRANIRKNAALAIKTIYMKILDILRKDSNYYTVVLNALKMDCIAQGRCLLGATEMGHLAMEYLDDRKFEYNRLEKEIKSNMKERQRTLKVVAKEVQFLSESFVKIIATENTANLDELYEGSETSAHSVHWELEDVLATCKSLQRDVRVPSFDDILPRLKEQRYQTVRLDSLLHSNSFIRDTLFVNRKHALLILDSLKNTGQVETRKYIDEKGLLRSNIGAERKEGARLSKDLDHKGQLISTLRNALVHVSQLLSCVGSSAAASQGAHGHGRRKEVPVAVQYALDDKLQAVPEVEAELDKIVSTSKQKLNVLMTAVSKIEITVDLKYSSKNFYQDLLMRIMRDGYKDEAVVEASLIEFEVDDPNVPNHDMVKLRSKQLVDAQVSEFDVPS